MNSICKVVWSEAHQQLVVVSELVRSGGKTHSNRSASPREQTLAVDAWHPRALCLALALGLGTVHAQMAPTTLPTGGSVSAGQASISQSGANMVINQSSQRAAINWQSFNVGADAQVQFNNGSGTTLNRVTGPEASTIAGRISATGQVIISNGNGVLFTPGSRIDVGGLVATTHAISDQAFMAGGDLRFERTGSTASVVNEGAISARLQGYVALLAPEVRNSGVIVAGKGTVALAAGEAVTLRLNANDQLQGVVVEGGAWQALVENRHVVEAPGGVVILSAKALASVQSGVINNTGTVEATQLNQVNGVVRLEASQAVVHTGTLRAPTIEVQTRNMIDAGLWDASALGNSANAVSPGGSIQVNASGSMEQTHSAHMRVDGAQGGSIRIVAQESAYISGSLSAIGTNGRGGDISLTAPSLGVAGATVNADGQSGGGRILIGGGWQGRDADLPNATHTTVSGGHIHANALQSGDGGTVVLWSDERTQFASSVEAKGGAHGGNGGQVEVSSHGTLQSQGAVDVTAAQGSAGSVLFDPANIEIVNSVTGMTVLSLADSVVANRYLGNSSITELVNGIPNTATTAADGTPTTFALTGIANYTGVTALNRIMVINSTDSTVASNAGSVRIFNTSTGALVSNLTGSSAHDQVGSGTAIGNLGNGKYVVSSSNWASLKGAVTWIDATTGLTGVVSRDNSLVGTASHDKVGLALIVLKNGNYVVRSPNWGSNNSNPFLGLGAVTWGSGATGIRGEVSSSNSLVGGVQEDVVGSSVIGLTNGNYVVASPDWDNAGLDKAGAVTWGNGATGITGLVSSANSLVGSTATDRVGTSVVALTNGHYVVGTPTWDNGGVINVGAATWGNGSTGTTGVVSSSNSLVGSAANDRVSFVSGSLVGVSALTNGNYVVRSTEWGGNTVTNGGLGAVTWGNGSTGTTGVVASSNSLVGSVAGDRVGGTGLTLLTNGNYVVSSANWSSGRGAATWGDGSTGITRGEVSAINSLVGSTGTDAVAFASVVALSNGNYVVGSPNWDNGAIANVGAVTWGNGLVGTVGTVSSANSLIGDQTGDNVGRGVVSLTNGNYVVRSDNWRSGGTSNAGLGAVTWGDGASGTTGVVSNTNSLVGSAVGDRVGLSVSALVNGNYVVQSTYWSSTGGSTSNGKGAVTWGSGTGGTVGPISLANSLVGAAAGDRIGSLGITRLTNGNYVVNSFDWGGAGVSNASWGAVTWGNGTGGTVGVVSATNSLVGSATGDRVGSAFITGLVNGNYLVRSPNWGSTSLSTTNGKGAVTWGNGTGGTVGEVSATNSLVGALAGDRIGSGSAVALMDGRAAVASPFWKSGSLANVGRVDIVDAQIAVNLMPTLAFSTNAANTSYVLASDIVNLLNAGTAVNLQANNDITVSSAITSTGAGAFTLNAGRSVLLNANITLNNANLSVIGNEWVTPVGGVGGGVIDAYRASGPAVITQAASTSLSVGTGNLSLILRAAGNTGKTNQATGAIALQSVSAANASVINDGTTAGSNVSLGTVNTSGNLSAVSNGILDLGTSTVGGNLSASSNNGHIVQTGALTVTGTSNLNAGTGDITLINAGNDFTGAVSATGTVVTINDSNALTLGTVSVSGNLALTNFGALNLGTSTVGGDLNATSNNGNISISGALTVSGNTNLNAGTGSVSVSGPAPAPAPAPAPSLDLASLTTAAQIQALTSAQIAGLSNEEVQSLTISQIGFFTGTQMSFFSVAQLRLLSQLQVLSLASSQLSALNSAQSAGLIMKLNSAQLQSLTFAQLKGLSATLVAEIAALLSPDQLQALTSSHLTGGLFNKMASIGRTSLTIDHFNPSQLTVNMDSPIQGIGVISQNSTALGFPERTAVSLTLGTARSGKGFSFELPEAIRSVAAAGKVVQVTRADGDDLPAWLKFDQSNMRLEANAVPVNALPLEIALVVGGQSTVVQISERID